MDIKYLLVLIAAMILTYISIPPLMMLAQRRKLLDKPDWRKQHIKEVPYFGGVGILLGFLGSILLFGRLDFQGSAQYIIAGSLIVFLIGLRDDMVNLKPFVKLIGQCIAAFFVVYLADLHLPSYFGVLANIELDPQFLLVCSIIICLVLINAINFMDGIDGLCASFMVFSCAFFAYVFLTNGDEVFAVMSLAMIGALAGFLIYNLQPATLFMGDAGSLFCGLVLSAFLFRFLMDQQKAPVNYSFAEPLAIGLITVCIPIYDFVRVILLRILRGLPPHKADRSHFHYQIIDAFQTTHLQTTAILMIISLLMLVVAIAAQPLGTFAIVAIVTVLLTVFSFLISKKR